MVCYIVMCSFRIPLTVRAVNPTRHVLCEWKAGLCESDADVLLPQEEDGDLEVVSCRCRTVRDVVLNSTEGAHLCVTVG